MELYPALKTGQLLVAIAPHAAREEATHLAVEVALRGPLTILDGGNRITPYHIAHLLRKQTVDIGIAADRLFIRRAFTCYQMLALLENTPPLQQPYLILDLLGTFYDDQVPDHEVRRLLGLCLQEINRLCVVGPVAVLLAPPVTVERTFLVEQVCERADQLFVPENQPVQFTQSELF
jgi:hypothetical protein